MNSRPVNSTVRRFHGENEEGFPKMSHNKLTPDPTLPKHSDPDPIAILTICFAGVGMVSGVATTLMHYYETRRRGREESRFESDALSDLLIVSDRLISIGDHLNAAIDALQRDASVALSFSTRQGISRESARPTFTFGANPIFVSGASKEMWNLLVDDVCANVQIINRFVLEYSEQVNLLFEKMRIWEGKAPGRMMEKELFYEARRSAHSFHDALAKFQALTAKTPLSRAQTLFQDLCGEAKNLIRSMDQLHSRLTRVRG
jgi:hypothetical protein